MIHIADPFSWDKNSDNNDDNDNDLFLLYSF